MACIQYKDKLPDFLPKNKLPENAHIANQSQNMCPCTLVAMAASFSSIVDQHR
jgi:hypothetical protein